jgi:hypothetical protein
MSAWAWVREVGAVVLVTGAGWALLRKFAPTLPGTLRLGLAWPIGSGLVAAAALAAILTGVPLAWATLVPVLALVAVALPAGGDGQAPGLGQTRWGPASILVVGAGAAAALGYRLTAPFPGWDGAGIWGMKARALLLGALPSGAPLTSYSQPEYPLQLPLVAAWLGAARGGWSDGALLTACWAGYVALGLLLVQAARPRSETPGWIVAAGVVPLGGLLSQVTQGTADITLAALVAGMLLCLQRWLRDGDGVALWVAAILTGLAAWTKFEGVVLGGLAWGTVVAVSGRFARRRLPPVRAAIVAAAIAAPWYVGLLVRQLPVDALSLAGAERLARLPGIVAAFTVEALTLERWGLLWPVSLALLGVAAWRRDRDAVLPAILLVGGVSTYAIVYLAAPHPALDVYMSASLPRIFIPLVPAATLLVATAADELWQLRTGLGRDHARKANRHPRQM